ncbi:MAG: cation:proton antiporter subunit C [Pseudomonadota bacterium]
MVEFILERGNYWAIIGLMMIGLYISFASTNLIKRLIGLGLFQTSIVLFYVSLSRVTGGTAPILYGEDWKKKKDKGSYGADSVGEASGATTESAEGLESAASVTADAYGAGTSELANVYSNPLPHVLMLTAIVVGVATLAVGLALIVRIREAYGTIESDEIRAMDLEVAIAEAQDEGDEAAGAPAT